VQKFKTLLDNKSEGVSHQTYFTIWLAFKTSLDSTGAPEHGKKKKNGAGGI
jgi:hypothetical protein